MKLLMENFDNIRLGCGDLRYIPKDYRLFLCVSVLQAKRVGIHCVFRTSGNELQLFLTRALPDKATLW